MEAKEEENTQRNQQNILPNNPSDGISSSSTEDNSNEELWSIYLDINAICCI